MTPLQERLHIKLLCVGSESMSTKIFCNKFFMNDDQLKNIPQELLIEHLELSERLAELQEKETIQTNFLPFVKSMWQDFIEGEHHRIMSRAFDRIASGDLKRLIINMPPRHTKSEFASYLFPAYLVGKNPGLKIIQATHTADLAVRFGRKIRDLIDTRQYRDIFPNVELNPESKAAGRWETRTTDGKLNGEYYAAGVGGALAGRGADLFIIDDPHSEQDAMSQSALDDAYEWYMTGPRQRLQPGGAIVIVMTRWSKRDLTGRVVKKMMEDQDADQWEIIELPAILPSGKSLWEGYWKLSELQKIKASISPSKWAAEYMQNPTGEGASIINRDWIKIWDRDNAPKVDYVIQSYDTAFLKSERADFSAITTWGVFYPEGAIGDEHYPGNEAHIILLNSVRDRFSFPELKQKALEQYEEWTPESVIIEGKASGMPLTQELRSIGIPVQTFTPSRGQDKIARVNACTPLFSSGYVWVSEHSWAEQLVDELCDFPNGEHDDLVDSTTQALMRFRQGGFVKLDTDYEDEPITRRSRIYY
jgi:predicted phage terminase large subunit-like protein